MSTTIYRDTIYCLSAKREDDFDRQPKVRQLSLVPEVRARPVPEALTLAQSRLTAQGLISVPAEVRRRLGVGPGSLLEWDVEGESVVIRRAGRYSSEDVHRALFPKGSGKGRHLEEMDEGIRRYIRSRHARR